MVIRRKCILCNSSIHSWYCWQVHRINCLLKRISEIGAKIIRSHRDRTADPIQTAILFDELPICCTLVDWLSNKHCVAIHIRLSNSCSVLPRDSRLTARNQFLILMFLKTDTSHIDSYNKVTTFSVLRRCYTKVWSILFGCNASCDLLLLILYSSIVIESN